MNAVGKAGQGGQETGDFEVGSNIILFQESELGFNYIGFSSQA